MSATTTTSKLPFSDLILKPQLPTTTTFFITFQHHHSYLRRKRRNILPSTNAIYTQSQPLPPTEKQQQPPQRSLSATTDWQKDPIFVLNERIRRDYKGREMAAQKAMDPEVAEKYILQVMEQIKASKSKQTGDGGEQSYSVDPRSLKEGEYVVHRKVGVGMFVAIRDVVPENGGDVIEYVFIQYADGMAKLPLSQASRFLFRYNLPDEKKKPRSLSKIGDRAAWEKRMKKGKVAVQRMVVNLMEFYLHRRKQTRPPYPKTPLMTEFDAMFPYEPTPHQKQAFMDVERDLTELEIPMDRLICGDVGFGKTEVALRAIFCVVSAGKQALVLAPTIVLAKQHYNVITERFSKYPDIKVGLLTRFQSSAEKRTFLDMFKNGEAKILVGTHVLLANRVAYSNLGLLVIDEEQRFGVKQKEKIASFKTSVDILTLSATPIPRTLYLALQGFRDASLIATPPPERVPIKTLLSDYSEETVKSAIEHELDRDGQVFYVVPRIQGLQKVENFLRKSFPLVSVAVAHGKQDSKQLEDIMEDFVAGYIRILVSTNIVESGLDIPNANTIIIQDIHHFGLAQLYQLRGRVGRADKEAYAYLLYPDISKLSQEALDRLKALEDCLDLGQGFQLAKRDMGIRGFGSIFGEQQTGDIGNVGNDLFFEMLFESLSKVDEHRVRSIPYQTVQLDLNINPQLPSEYINYLDNPRQLISEAEKAAKNSMLSLVQFTENLRCQYGKEPHSMEILLKKLYVIRMAADLGINRIYASGKKVFMDTNMNKKVFGLMKDSMLSDTTTDNCMTYEDGQILAELLLELPREQLLNWIFRCLAALHSSLPVLIKY